MTRPRVVRAARGLLVRLLCGRELDALYDRVYQLEHALGDVLERVAPPGCVAMNYALRSDPAVSLCQNSLTGTWSAWGAGGRCLVRDAPTAAACAQAALQRGDGSPSTEE